jgi:hypothetical protein
LNRPELANEDTNAQNFVPISIRRKENPHAFININSKALGGGNTKGIIGGKKLRNLSPYQTIENPMDSISKRGTNGGSNSQGRNKLIQNLTPTVSRGNCTPNNDPY